MYKISRPPLCKMFELPSRKDLLNVKKGDFVKLIFSYEERMWVKVTKQTMDEWEGTLANEPYSLKNVKFGQKIKFHPLDVIDINTAKRGARIRLEGG